MINDIHEQPDGEIHMARCGSIPSAGSSVPLQLGCATLPAHRCAHQPISSPNSILWEFNGGFLM